MKTLERSEVAEHLGNALRAAIQETRCSRIQEGAVVVVGDKSWVGYRTLRSGTSLTLCRGECIMAENKKHLCPAEHAVRTALFESYNHCAFNGRLYMVRLVLSGGGKKFIIPSDFCCERCRMLCVGMGCEAVFWGRKNDSSGCMLYSPEELKQGIHKENLPPLEMMPMHQVEDYLAIRQAAISL